MAEVRKHQPDAGDGLGRLVREALGERIRPTEPGRSGDGQRSSDQEQEPEPDEPSASSLPDWPSGGPAFTF